MVYHEGPPDGLAVVSNQGRAALCDRGIYLFIPASFPPLIPDCSRGRKKILVMQDHSVIRLTSSGPVGDLKLVTRLLELVLDVKFAIVPQKQPVVYR